MFVSALEHLLREEAELDVVATATDSDRALDLIRKTKPDIAVLDVRMPPDGGLAVARTLQNDRSATRVVILAAGLGQQEAMLAMQLGVRGVILKEMAPTHLIRCIQKVHAGGEWFEMKSASKAISSLLARENNERDLQSVLTPREYEVLRVAASGISNLEIAEKLSVGEGTVKMHLHSIYDKLSLRGRVDLMAFAHKRGLQE